ncbi:hypothetical protein GQ53DRAFT_756924 [Thozetella sp. PMI_491]|nr:hypothetical protein GQ53DRAFT_756924 [Thozetella sp. PMI_491]
MVPTSWLCRLVHPRPASATTVAMHSVKEADLPTIPSPLTHAWQQKFWQGARWLGPTPATGATLNGLCRVLRTGVLGLTALVKRKPRLNVTLEVHATVDWHGQTTLFAYELLENAGVIVDFDRASRIETGSAALGVYGKPGYEEHTGRKPL